MKYSDDIYYKNLPKFGPPTDTKIEYVCTYEKFLKPKKYGFNGVHN